MSFGQFFYPQSKSCFGGEFLTPKIPYSIIQTTFTSVDFYLNQEHCPLGQKTPGTYTIVCTTSFPHYNVTKAVLAISEYSKPPNEIIKFSVSPVILAGNPMTSFGAQLNVSSPSVVGLKLGFFLVVVKKHRFWIMNDLIHFSKFRLSKIDWDTGSPFDNQDNLVRTDIKSFVVSTSTIFSSRVADLIVHVFTCSFYLEPQMDLSSNYNHSQILDYSLTTSVNTTSLSIDVLMTLQPLVRMEKFNGFVLIMNNSEFARANVAGWRYGFNALPFSSSVGFFYNLSVEQPLYGPSFYGKCFFGIDKLAYTGNDDFNYEIGFTPIYYTVVSYTQTNGAAVTNGGIMYCVGRYIRCYEFLPSHLDQYTLQCYTSATCPLPIYPGYTSYSLCPRCADLVCQRCDIATRKICSSCRGDLFSLLNTTSKGCQCLVNYMPLHLAVTTTGQGLWGSQNTSLYLCKVNCSAAIKKCIFGACKNETYCDSCEYGTVLNPIAVGKRICTRCSLILANCVACSETNLCDLCGVNTFLLENYDSSGNLIIAQCRPCRQKIQYCAECTQDGVCISCTRPFDLGLSGNCDICLSTYQNFSGICMLYHGCMATKQITNETEICVVCIPNIHYFYDETTQSCICQKGYYESPDPQYWYVCVPRCGDGVTTSLVQDCDDGNTKNGDGCNEFCKVEAGFSCLPYEPSKCVFNINFQLFQFQYVYRIMGQNKGIFYFKVLPHDIRLETMQWQSLIHFNFSQSAVDLDETKITYSYDLDQLEIQVPYNEELENLFIQTKISLYQEFVVSDPSEFVLNYQINGINAPLIFETLLILKTQKMVDLLSSIMSFVVLLQFFIGSYVSKMIGLETLQVIQTIYFVRMAIASDQSTFLNSLNSLKYTIVGYSNPQLMFQDIRMAKNEIYSSQPGVFQSIGMNKFFLLNINFFLLMILIVLGVYLRYFHRKLKIRADFIKTRSQQIKDQYTKFNRKAEWVYIHVFFPVMMMYNFVFFFTTISSEQENIVKQLVPLRTVEKVSFPFYSAFLYMIIAVWSFEIFNSYEEFRKSRMTEEEKSKVPCSLIEKLEHDGNSPNRPNFSPFYILVYFSFYLILQFAMVLPIFVQNFYFTLEALFGLSLVYFGLIWKWSPYNSTINVHNNFLRLNHGTVAFFLLTFIIFKYFDNIPEKVQVALIYTNIGMLMLVTLGGFVRVYYEHKYRFLGLEQAATASKKAKDLKNLNDEFKLGKKGHLLINNKYFFDNQLEEIGKRHGVDYKGKESGFSHPSEKIYNELKKETLIYKIREEIRHPDQFPGYKQKKKKTSDRIDTSLRINTFEEPSLPEIKQRLRKQYQERLIKSKDPSF